MMFACQSSCEHTCAMKLIETRWANRTKNDWPVRWKHKRNAKSENRYQNLFFQLKFHTFFHKLLVWNIQINKSYFGCLLIGFLPFVVGQMKKGSFFASRGLIFPRSLKSIKKVPLEDKNASNIILIEIKFLPIQKGMLDCINLEKYVHF